MILRPEDENITGQPRRVSFTGVGASRTSLCASPDDEKDAYCNEQISRSHGNYGKNQSSIPSSGDVNDDVKSEDGHDGTVNDEDDQSGHDHRKGGEMFVSRNQLGNEGVGANGIDDNEVEGNDHVENEKKDHQFYANDVDDDESSKTSASRDENGVDGDNSPGCEEVLGDQHVPAHGDERESVDDDQCHPTSSHSLEIKGSMSMDSLQSSSHHGQNFDAKPYQGDSTPSLQMSAKRQSETCRKCSDASIFCATRSRRSSSSSSSASSSGSSTESSSGSDSDSSSTNSDSSSCSSSCSSSSSSSSNSDSSSSDSSSSSSSGSDSASSRTDDEERQNYNTRAGKRYRVLSRKSRRASSSDSGQSSSDSGTSSSDSSRSSPDSGRSSLSFASELEGRNKKKKSRELYHVEGLCAQTSTKSHERMKQYKQSQKIVHQETCSPVCVIS